MPLILENLYRVAHSVASNVLAMASPRLYIRLTNQTGRGESESSAKEVADYFWQCFHDYFIQLGIAPEDTASWLSGKTVLEYGPGDVPAVAVLMIAYGAEKAWCVDRFPLVQLSAKNLDVIREVLQKLPAHARRRAEACFRVEGDPASGFNPDRIAYQVASSGLSGLRGVADLVYSRAVLEHVDDMDATYLDMAQALAPDGIAIHLVDLASHRMHRQNRLDFLVASAWLWTVMHSHKGVPNRWRRAHHLASVARAGLTPIRCETTKLADPADVAAIRPFLASPFRSLEDDEIACLGFWLICKRTPA